MGISTSGNTLHKTDLRNPLQQVASLSYSLPVPLHHHFVDFTVVHKHGLFSHYNFTPTSSSRYIVDISTVLNKLFPIEAVRAFHNHCFAQYRLTVHNIPQVWTIKLMLLNLHAFNMSTAIVASLSKAPCPIRTVCMLMLTFK